MYIYAYMWIKPALFFDTYFFLVPIAGQREALLLKDAKMLAKTMCKQLPASRHGEAGEAVAQAFLDEAKKQGV